ncbi:MAG: A24 family peptidase [Patescibacteria group bacterium]|nr:A24 family peptidase [Patescibacteria group bacterium]
MVALTSFPVGAESIGAVAFANLLLGWFVVSVLVIVFVYDLRYMLIPRSITLPATVLALAANVALGMDIAHLVIGVAIGGGFFWLQRLLSKGKWVGGGDVYLGLFMGAVLGYPLILVALFIAYVAGALIGVSLMVIKRKTMKSELPFGTFLAAGTVFTLLYGQVILGWYMGLL